MNGKICWIFLVIVIVVGLAVPPYTSSAATPAKRVIAAVGQEPTTLDQSLGITSPDYIVHQNWGEYPIRKAPSGDLGPGLATSWKVSPDGKQIEFTLRKGVKFHSGDSLSSKDVLFSFERGRTKNPTAKTMLSSVERLEVIDDHHFKFHFKAFDVAFIPNLGCVPIVSKTYHDRVGEDKFIKEPVGTGPYKFLRYSPGEYVDIERFEDYWGEKPPVKEARIYFISEDTTRVAKLMAGEVDIIGSCPYSLLKDVQKHPGLKVIKLATDHPTPSVAFATRNPNVPWHDRRVRLAMAYAIDWRAIVNNILQGIPNHYAFLSPHQIGYDPELKPYPYDPKKAKELLAEAGYPKGFDFKFYWPMTGRFPMAREMTEAIASYLEAVGIRTKLMGDEWATYLSRRRGAKGPEAEYVSLIGGGRSGGSDPIYTIDIFFGCDGGFSVYCNPDLDKVVAEGRSTVDETKRAELVKKAVRIIHEDVASIPIYNTVVIYAMKKNIDFKPTQRYTHDLMLIKDITVE
jgi:peptide/nickel transport system substrate-binding protein